jgi:hypothetical protein
VKREMTLRQKYSIVYHAWKAMKQRTQNPRCKAYHNYGGRGITLCDEWQEFEPFCEWARTHGWKKGLELDRIDNDKGYYPENCRWVTRRENTNNRRCTITVSVTLPISYWADITEIPIGSLKIWYENRGEHFVRERIISALLNGYRKKDYGNTHRLKVLHVESGMMFESIRSAAKYFEMSSGSLSVAIKEGRKTSKGTFVLKDGRIKSNPDKNVTEDLSTKSDDGTT